MQAILNHKLTNAFTSSSTCQLDFSLLYCPTYTLWRICTAADLSYILLFICIAVEEAHKTQCCRLLAKFWKLHWILAYNIFFSCRANLYNYLRLCSATCLLFMLFLVHKVPHGYESFHYAVAADYIFHIPTRVLAIFLLHLVWADMLSCLQVKFTTDS